MSKSRGLRRFECAMWRLARLLAPRDPWTQRSAYPATNRRLGGTNAVVKQEENTS